ncbi:hypothetical protein [Robiginitalea marina]|uniref:Uncharacterized protein n=1 Tax=Robiginitalea marina TaxID=2954105 RepID=A0ABT1AZW0_9FLAO|nr:hypothetical protein [Robiginitalea marina]MCO5725522.1 hypothetical protein [Robiginitalea marina]
MKETIDLNTAFSIELETSNNWRLEPRGKYQGLPLYESLGGKVSAIAIVENPAIGEKAVGIGNDRIMGLVMIPDLKIFRNLGPNGPERCYWYFSAETIKELQRTYEGEAKLGH